MEDFFSLLARAGPPASPVEPAPQPRRRRVAPPVNTSPDPFSFLPQPTPAAVLPPPVSETPVELPQPEPGEEGLLSKIGYVLDTPGAYLRGILAGEPGERVSGQRVLKNMGVISKDDNPFLSLPGLGGFAADVLLDPLNLLPGFMGIKAATKAQRATKLVGGHLDEAEKLAATFLREQKAAKGLHARAAQTAAEAGQAIPDFVPKTMDPHPIFGDLLRPVEKVVPETGEIYKDISELERIANPELVQRLASRQDAVGDAAREILANKQARGLGDEAFEVAEQAGERVRRGQEALFSVGGEVRPFAPLPGLGRLGFDLPQKTLVEGAGAAQKIQDAWQGFAGLPIISDIGDLFQKTAGLAGAAGKTVDKLRTDFMRSVAGGEAEAARGAESLLEEIAQIPPGVRAPGPAAADLSAQADALLDEAEGLAKQTEDELELGLRPEVEPTFAPVAPAKNPDAPLPMMEDFEAPAKGHQVRFNPRDAEGSANPNIRKQQTGKVLSIDEETGRAIVENQHGQWIMPGNKIQRVGANARADYDAAVMKHQQQTISPEVRNLAADARKLHLEQTAIPDELLQLGGRNAAGVQNMGQEANAYVKGERDALLKNMGIDDVGPAGQAAALPKLLEDLLPKVERGEAPLPNLGAVDLVGDVVPGDKLRFAGHPWEATALTPEGKIHLKDGELPDIEVPEGLVPKDRGTEIARRGADASMKDLGDPFADLQAAPTNVGKLNKAIDVLADAEQKLGVKPAEIPRGGAQHDTDFAGAFSASGGKYSDGLKDTFVKSLNEKGRIPSIEKGTGIGRAVQAALERGYPPQEAVDRAFEMYQAWGDSWPSKLDEFAPPMGNAKFGQVVEQGRAQIPPPPAKMADDPVKAFTDEELLQRARARGEVPGVEAGLNPGGPDVLDDIVKQGRKTETIQRLNLGTLNQRIDAMKTKLRGMSEQGITRGRDKLLDNVRQLEQLRDKYVLLQKEGEKVSAIGAKTAEAATAASKILPKDASMEVMQRVTKWIEHGGDEAPEIVAVAQKIKARYEDLLKLEQTAGLKTPSLKADSIEYTTHVPTQQGRGFFKSLQKFPKKQAEVFVALEQARQAKGIKPTPGMTRPELGAAAEQALKDKEVLRNTGGLGSPGAKRGAVSKLNQHLGEKELLNLDAGAREFILQNGLKDEFLEFSRVIDSHHGSQVPRLKQYRELGVDELNNVFQRFNGKAPVFNVNPAAQQFTREARHIRSMAGQKFLDESAEKLGKPVPTHHDAPLPAGNGLEKFPDGSLGIEELNKQRRLRGLEPIAMDPQTAAALQAAHARLLDPEEVPKLLQWYDGITRIAKQWVTRPFPGFHIGNHISNRIQGWLGGVAPAGEHYALANKALAGQDFTVKMGDGVTLNRDALMKEMEQNKVVNGGYFEDVMDQSLPERLRSKASYDITDPNNIFVKNPLIDTGEQLSTIAAGAPGRLASGAGVKDLGKFDGSMIENTDRAGMYIALRQKGLAPAAAADQVNTYLFDYSKANMSPFEEKYLNRAVFFYGYSRNVLPMMLEAATKNLPSVKKITQLSQQPGKPEYLPEYAREGVGLNTGIDADGKRTVAYSLRTPVEAAVEPFAAGLPGLLNQLNPIPKIPLELGTGLDFFLQRPIESNTKAPHYVEDLPDPLQQLLGVTQTQKKDGTTKTEMDPMLLYALSKSPLSRFSNTASRLADDRKGVGENLANLLTGARIVSVDENEERDRAQVKAIDAALKDMRAMGKSAKNDATYKKLMMAKAELVGK